VNFEKLKGWVQTVKRDVLALWIAARDPRTPWYAKAVAAAIAAYALSPIDLIPDFIPIIGLLDDMLIIPLGIFVAIKLIPPELMAEFRRKAAEAADQPVSKIAAAFIVLLWMACGIGLMWWIFKTA